MIAPYFTGSLYNDDQCYSPVQLDPVDLDRFPAMRDVPVTETVLEPGECLFIPLGWWHWVRSLEISTSLTFTNFLRDEPPLIWHQVMR
jgi:ribosomal protein L16 Arg81 hydroxylase